MKRHPGLYDVTEERARRLPNVEFLGFVPHEEIREQFLAADMLVSTSEPAREGFPNVFLQAWSAGLPVVTTCDPDGIIASHGLGSACESTDDLTESILTLSADTDLRAEIGHRARAWVRTHHSPEQVGGRLENVLESLLLDCDAGPD
jgi:glycosyltransferase involved in cell wall biosynthesis